MHSQSVRTGWYYFLKRRTAEAESDKALKTFIPWIVDFFSSLECMYYALLILCMNAGCGFGESSIFYWNTGRPFLLLSIVSGVHLVWTDKPHFQARVWRVLLCVDYVEQTLPFKQLIVLIIKKYTTTDFYYKNARITLILTNEKFFRIQKNLIWLNNFFI